MRLENILLGAAFLAAGTDAQSSATATESTAESETATSTSTASDGAQTHHVNVGLAGFKFDPDEIEASPGDTVRFEFFPPDHSVIRAAFSFPCIPWEFVTRDGYPFYSGVQYINTVSETTTFDVLVNDTEPIFYYCGAPDSCMGEGMIGVINPNKTQTLELQKDARDDFNLTLIPGDEWPKEGNPLSSVTGLVVTETGQPTATSTADTSGNDDDDDDPHNSTLSAGQIAGIAIGGAALLVIVGAVVYFCGRRGGLEKGYRKSAFLGGSSTNANHAQQGLMAEPTYTTASPDISKHVPSGVSSQYGLGVGHPGTPPVSPGMSNRQSEQYAGMPSPQYHQGPTSPQPYAEPAEAPASASAPVELPASADPGNSPLPQYSNEAGNTYSWGPREESGYRPGPKS
ncbi:hypothetical protein MKZ38_008777 [Zalerion maritima]|uniref:Extracellular serine-rich protein n=1 Tax=Zalerion maritima TaxID=339359 RepID=A0AAD5RU35_9PEZI|nr:hypothetical protein MKZ38_008777 [Zalerion maritima]